MHRHNYLSGSNGQDERQREPSSRSSAAVQQTTNKPTYSPASLSSGVLAAYHQKQAIIAAINMYMQQPQTPRSYHSLDVAKQILDSPSETRDWDIDESTANANPGNSWKLDELSQILSSEPLWRDGSNDSSSTLSETLVGSSYVYGYTPPRVTLSTTAANAGDRPETVWTGTMPVRVYKNARFSQKLFIGGLPLTIKSGELQKAFGGLGNVRVMLPKARNTTAASQIIGYCHIVVKDGKSIKRLLSKCQKSIDNPDDSITLIVQSFEYFYDLQLNNTVKRVQVIPWCINDSSYTNQMNSSAEKHVVFVGALHGIMTAEFLGRVMSDLFGNIEFVALDTDRFEYPIGSARVGFTNRHSYLKALKTNFVKIKTSRFTKVVQIEPYLEDSACSVCIQCIGVNFCKSDLCFRYYCSQCWERVHSGLDREAMADHQRLVKKRQDQAE